MQSDPLHALAPVDGRYARAVDPLRAHLSEAALIRTRIRVEAAWFVALARAAPSALPVAAGIARERRSLVVNSTMKASYPEFA